MTTDNDCPWRTDTYQNTSLALMHTAAILRGAADYHAACCVMDAEALYDATVLIEDIALTMQPAHQPNRRPDETEAP